MIKPLLKPGTSRKKQPKSSRTLIHSIEQPKERECCNCDVLTGTENYHHAESSRIKFLDGGGITGGKINDYLSAWLCSSSICGERFDNKPPKTAPQHIKDRHDLFSFDCIVKTWLIKK